MSTKQAIKTAAAKKAAPAKRTTSKAAASKATPAKRTTSKATPVKKATPAKRTSKAAAKQAPTRQPINAKSLKASPALPDDQAARVGETSGVAGYVVRWPGRDTDLLVRTDTARGDGALWLVRCNTHNTTTPAANQAERRELRKADNRRSWCKGCKAAK